MAHEIGTHNGQHTFAHVGEAAWHKLGVQLTGSETPEEWLAAAGMNRTIIKEDLRTVSGKIVHDKVATRYEDGEDVLGIVSRHYKPFQNREAAKFLENLVGTGELKLNTMGALRKGETIWILAEAPNDIVVKGDAYKKYILITNRHDGMGSFRGLLTPTRVVCNNTLTYAMKDGQNEGFAIRHRGNLQDNVQAAQQMLGLAIKGFDRIEEQLNVIHDLKVTKAQINEVLNKLYPDPEKKEGDEEAASKVNAANTRNLIAHLFEKGIGNEQPGVAGTGGALLNAVTEYVDHHLGMRSQGAKKKAGNMAQLERRVESMWFKTGADVKRQAFNLITDIATKGKLEEVVVKAKAPRKSRSGGVLIN